ncbi:MAG: tRNA-dihydrouridine synthase family protein [Candidatus Aenigmatarchaeota archaeon]
MLAPLEDMTSNAFRTLCHRYGADLTFTEMAKVGALAKNNKSTWSRLECKDETPTVIQLLGSKEQHFRKFLDMFEPSKAFRGFNINLGCPSPDVIKFGQGCAMIRKISKTRKIIDIFRDYGFDVSIKMRLGMNEKEKEYKVYLKIIESADADFFVIHARHGMQTYASPADFEVYEECAKTGKVIIANGDIRTMEQVEYLKDIGINGVMIGRSAVLDPAIFNRLKDLPSPQPKKIKEEYLILSEKFQEPLKYKNNILRRIGMSDMPLFDNK